MPIRVQTPHGIVEFPDGMSEQDMAAALSQLPAPTSSHEPAPPEDFSKYGPLSQLMRDAVHPDQAAKQFKENLPTLGAGLAAAATGGAGLIPAGIAAGGGAFLGARLRGDDRSAATREGAIGTLTEVGGGLVARGLAGGARRLYAGLLKPKQAVKDSFGGGKVIADTLLAERVPISEGGVKKVTGKLGESRANALRVVTEAQQAGTPGVGARDVVSKYAPVIEELRKRIDIGQPSELARVGQRGRAITKTASRAGGQIPLTRAQQLKETAQDASSGAYRVMERGGQKQLSADDLLDTATARGLKEGIESKVPAVASHNQRSQKLIGATRALEDAVERESGNNRIGGGRDWAALGAAGLGAAGGGPVGAAAAGAGMRLLTTPSTGSRIAIGMNELANVPFAQLVRMAQIAALEGKQ